MVVMLRSYVPVSHVRLEVFTFLKYMFTALSVIQELRSGTYFINGFTVHEIDATLEYICTM